MGNSSVVRINARTREVLEELSRKSGEPMLSIIEKAIENYRRRVFLEQTNLAYARLREDKKASQAFDEELKAWDATLGDGLESPESRQAPPKRSSGTRGGKAHGKSRTR